MSYIPKVHGDGPDRTVVESGGEIDILSGGALKFAGVNRTAALAAVVAGAAAGYKLARGVSAVTGTLAVTTGLATVVAVVAMLAEDPSTAALWVTAAIPTQTGGDAGKFTAKVWKPTAANDCTPIAADAAKDVAWIAVGT